MDDLDSLCLASAIAAEKVLCPLYLDSDEICLDTALAHCAVIQHDPLFSFNNPLAFRSSTTSPLHPSELLPVPSTKCKEIRLRVAKSLWDPEKSERTTKMEIDKQIRIGCLSEDNYSKVDLPADCAAVIGVVIYKDKRDGRATARMAANGPRSLT